MIVIHRVAPPCLCERIGHDTGQQVHEDHRDDQLIHQTERHCRVRILALEHGLDVETSPACCVVEHGHCGAGGMVEGGERHMRGTLGRRGHDLLRWTVCVRITGRHMGA